MIYVIWGWSLYNYLKTMSLISQLTIRLRQLELLYIISLNHIPYSKYLSNWSLQDFSMNYDLVSYITYVVWVSLTVKRQNSKNKFFRVFSWQIYLLPEFLPEIDWEVVSGDIFSSISFCWKGLTWGLKHGFVFNHSQHTRLQRLLTNAQNCRSTLAV